PGAPAAGQPGANVPEMGPVLAASAGDANDDGVPDLLLGLRRKANDDGIAALAAGPHLADPSSSVTFGCNNSVNITPAISAFSKVDNSNKLKFDVETPLGASTLDELGLEFDPATGEISGEPELDKTATYKIYMYELTARPRPGETLVATTSLKIQTQQC